MRSRAIRASLAVLVTLLGAASVARGQSSGLRVGIAASSEPVLLDTLAHAYKLSAPRDRAYAGIIVAYDSLGIPVDFKDTHAGVAVAERFQVRRELKKVPLSRYLDCGMGMNGVNANIYRVTLVVASWLEPTSGALSQVRVAVVGSGQDMTGSNSQSVLCTSKGVLEDVMMSIVRRHVAQGS